MKTLGIILAAGSSRRLYPATFVNTKQLLPVFDKPLIYYPLSVLMQAGVRDYVIISNPSEQESFRRLLGQDQDNLGVSFEFLVQPVPTGIADAFNIVAASLRAKLDSYERIALILGDNIFYGKSLELDLRWAASYQQHAVVFVKQVDHPERFGVISLDSNGRPVKIEEKPKFSQSDLAVTGLYFYPKSVFEYARQLTPSDRGELEITDINRMYLEKELLFAQSLSKDTAWFDTGTADSLLDAAIYIREQQQVENLLIGSPHAEGYYCGWIGAHEIKNTAARCDKTRYGQYLRELVEQKQ
jgi:glucose-1-phosphate thymidylyltransferase